MSKLSAFEVYHLTKTRTFGIKSYKVRQHIAFFESYDALRDYFHDKVIGNTLEISDDCVLVAIRSADSARVVLDINKNYFQTKIVGKNNCKKVLQAMISVGIIVECGKTFWW